MEVGDADEHEEVLFTRGVSFESGLPLGFAELRLQVIWGEHGNDASALLKGAMHVTRKHAAGFEIPSLNDGGEIRLLQLPSDPHGPSLVFAGVTDEEVDGSRCCWVRIHGDWGV